MSIDNNTLEQLCKGCGFDLNRKTLQSSGDEAIWLTNGKQLLLVKNGGNATWVVAESYCIERATPISLTNNYAVFEYVGNSLRTYRIYDLQGFHRKVSSDGILYPSYECKKPSYNKYAYIPIHHAGKCGLFDLNTSDFIVPIIYTDIQYWEAYGHVFSIVELAYEAGDRVTQMAGKQYKGLFIDKRIVVPPVCHTITFFGSTSNFQFEINSPQDSQYMGIIKFEGWNGYRGYIDKDKLVLHGFYDDFSILHWDGEDDYAMTREGNRCILYHSGAKICSLECANIEYLSSRTVEDGKIHYFIIYGDTHDEQGLISDDGSILVPIGKHKIGYVHADRDFLCVFGDNIYFLDNMEPLVESEKYSFIDINLSVRRKIAAEGVFFDEDGPWVAYQANRSFDKVSIFCKGKDTRKMVSLAMDLNKHNQE